MKTPIAFLHTLLCAAIASFLIVLAQLPPVDASNGRLGDVATETVRAMTMVGQNT